MSDSLLWKRIKEIRGRFGHWTLLVRDYLLPDGRTETFIVRHGKNGGKIACILALTPENDVLLAEQFRPGPEKLIKELPGGGIEKNESPEDGARRELLEETGYAGTLQLVTASPVDAYSTFERYHFVATNCMHVQEQRGDDNEFIRVVKMPLDEFKAYLMSGGPTDIATGFLGLSFLGLL